MEALRPAPKPFRGAIRTQLIKLTHSIENNNILTNN